MTQTTLNLALLAVSMGFPEPRTELAFAYPERRWLFDLAWPSYMLALEREGNTWTKGKVIPGVNSGKSRHTTGFGYRNDVDKYNEAALRGWCVLRVTADMLQEGSAWTLLERALKSRGWQP